LYIILTLVFCLLEFGPDDYALFKGKVVEFRMTKRTVVMGRSTANSTVDFDLSMEGPAFKVSRRQVSICLENNRKGGLTFYIYSNKLLVLGDTIA